MADPVDALIGRFPRDGYLLCHAKRYSKLLRLVREEWRRGERILDIGRSNLTQMIAESLGTRVDSLGFQPDSDTPSGKHYHLDLNDCQDYKSWRKDMRPYDVVVFAEVIEHLYTSPMRVLAFINSITSDGGRVILQTPNAAALHKRLKMIFGRNPYERIREDATNPGHFREYTRAEVISYARETGYKVKDAEYGNYYDYRYFHAGGVMVYKRPRVLLNYLYAVVPRSLRPGMTFVLVKVGEAGFAEGGGGRHCG